MERKGSWMSQLYKTISSCLLVLEKQKNRHCFYQILCHAIASGVFAADPSVSSKLLLHSLSYSHHDPQFLAFSHTLFFQIPSPNIFAWNFMFKAQSHASSPLDCISLYNLMRRRSITFPDNYSFSFLLKACARLSLLSKGQELHSLTLLLGLERDVFVQNGLVSMYAQCGLVETAHRVFNMVPIWVRDVVSWNAVISGYLSNSRSGRALKVFEEMLTSNSVRPDEVTLVSVLAACGRIALPDLGRKIHGLLTANGFPVDTYLGSSLIDMYFKCGEMGEAVKIFDRMPERNVVCWTSLITGHVQSDLFKEAIQLFRNMLVEGIMADAASAACVISACGHSGSLDQGTWVHSFCERTGIDKNLSVKNALIDMYSKCGNIQRALHIFHDLTEKDVFSWTSMIIGLAMNGEADKALNLYSEMVTSSYVMPNEVTFLGVLSACCHGGYVDKGFRYFKVMTQTYKLTPRIEHYGCLVDLLGRANLLVEAESLIRAMPIKPDVVIWRSLLFACQISDNVELAELAARKIEELEPGKSGQRVLLSNAYALASRWNDVKKTREGVGKQPGCSFVEIDGVVHEFFAADNLYNQKSSISKLVQSTGFEPIILT